MRIGTKLALFFIIIMALAVGLLSWAYTENAGTAIAERTDAQLESIGLLKIGQLDYYRTNEMNHLVRIAGRLGGSGSADNESVLNQELAAQTDFDTLFVMGLNGTVMASTYESEKGMDVSNESYFKGGGAGTVFMSYFYPPGSGKAAAYFSATPIKDESGRTVAVLGARADLNETSALMLEPAGMGMTGEVYLTDSYGIPITALKKKRNDTAPLHTLAVTNCLRGDNGSATAPDYHGDLVIERYFWLQEDGICLISKIDRSEAFMPIDQVNGEVMLIAAILLLGFTVAVALAVQKLLSPIDELTRVVSAISKGDMGSEVNPRLKESGDEIGKLARAFDRTLVSLKLAMKETAPELKVESRMLKETLAERIKAEQRYKALIKTSPEVVVVTDSSGIINETSSRMLQVFKLESASEVLGTDAYGLLVPEAREAARKAITEALESEGEMNGVTLTMQRKDGSTFTAEVNIKRLKDIAGNHIGTILTLRDITKREAENKALREALDARTKAEEELKKEKNLAEMYLDIAGVMLVAIGADQKVTLINRKGCEVLGYSEPEIVGKNWFDTFVPKSERERTRAIFVKLMSGEIKGIEYYENPVLAKNGKEKLIAWHNTRLHEDDRIIGTLSSGEDITQLRFSDERLGAFGRLSSMTDEIGRMTADARRKGLGTEEIFGNACRILVEKGGFRMAWIGFTDPTTGMVKPLAHAGMEKGYLEGVRISTLNVPEGQGPTGTAIREDRVMVIEDWAKEPRMKLWQAAGAKRSYRSSAAFPLRKEGKPVGTLNVYSEKTGFFDHETVRALELTVEMITTAACQAKGNGKK